MPDPTPPPPIDLDEAETLAAHLFRQAATVRDRHAAIESQIELELAQARVADDESAAIRAEIEQYRGWLSGEREGGSAYRTAKAIQDERERRALLETELASLKERLAAASASLARLQSLGQNSAPAQQARAAESALAQLARLHALSQATAPT